MLEVMSNFHYIKLIKIKVIEHLLHDKIKFFGQQVLEVFSSFRQ